MRHRDGDTDSNARSAPDRAMQAGRERFAAADVDPERNRRDTTHVTLRSRGCRDNDISTNALMFSNYNV